MPKTWYFSGMQENSTRQTSTTHTNRRQTVYSPETIRTLRPSPSMSEDCVPFTGTYEQAIEECKRSWQKTGRRTSYVSGMTYWFTIQRNGETIDRNTVGAPKTGMVYRNA